MFEHPVVRKILKYAEKLYIETLSKVVLKKKSNIPVQILSSRPLFCSELCISWMIKYASWFFAGPMVISWKKSDGNGGNLQYLATGTHRLTSDTRVSVEESNEKGDSLNLLSVSFLKKTNFII